MNYSFPLVPQFKEGWFRKGDLDRISALRPFSLFSVQFLCLALFSRISFLFNSAFPVLVLSTSSLLLFHFFHLKAGDRWPRLLRVKSWRWWTWSKPFCKLGRSDGVTTNGQSTWRNSFRKEPPGTFSTWQVSKRERWMGEITPKKQPLSLVIICYSPCRSTSGAGHDWTFP